MTKKRKRRNSKKVIILDQLVMLNELAIEAIYNGDFDKAKRLLLAAKRKFDRYPPTNNNLAYVYFLEGNIKKAFKLIKEVLSIVPEHIYTHTLLAKVFIMQNNMREAQKHIDVAIEEFFKDRENLIYLDSIIDTLALARDPNKIIHFCERVLEEIDIDGIDMLKDLLYINLVIAYYNTRNFEKLNKLISTFDVEPDNFKKMKLSPICQAYILFIKALLDNKIYDHKFTFFSKTLELMFEHNKAAYKKCIKQLKDKTLATLFLPFSEYKKQISVSIMALLQIIRARGYNSATYKKIFEVIIKSDNLPDTYKSLIIATFKSVDKKLFEKLKSIMGGSYMKVKSQELAITRKLSPSKESTLEKVKEGIRYLNKHDFKNALTRIIEAFNTDPFNDSIFLLGYLGLRKDEPLIAESYLQIFDDIGEELYGSLLELLISIYNNKMSKTLLLYDKLSSILLLTEKGIDYTVLFESIFNFVSDKLEMLINKKLSIEGFFESLDDVIRLE